MTGGVCFCNNQLERMGELPFDSMGSVELDAIVVSILAAEEAACAEAAGGAGDCGFDVHLFLRVSHAGIAVFQLDPGVKGEIPL